jgi:hypothetical protein
MIYRDHFFDTMERVRTAKEEQTLFPYSIESASDGRATY